LVGKASRAAAPRNKDTTNAGGGFAGIVEGREAKEARREL